MPFRVVVEDNPSDEFVWARLEESTLDDPTHYLNCGKLLFSPDTFLQFRAALLGRVDTIEVVNHGEFVHANTRLENDTSKAPLEAYPLCTEVVP